MFDGVVSFYSGFVYNIFISAFSYWGHVFLTLQLHWLEGCVVLLMDAIFLLWFFYYLGHVACAIVANLNVVFVKDFGKGAIIGEVLANKKQRAAHVPSHTHALYTTHTYTHNNTQL